VDLDTDEVEAQGAETPAPPADDLTKKIARLEADNFKLREERRRADFIQRHGDEVAELVPPSLPADEAETLAERLKERLAVAQPVQTEQATEEAPREEPTPQEIALAAVSKGSEGSSSSPSRPTPEEALELVKNNPDELPRLKKVYGENVLARLPGNQ
jgi:hypothetical protein